MIPLFVWSLEMTVTYRLVPLPIVYHVTLDIWGCKWWHTMPTSSLPLPCGRPIAHDLKHPSIDCHAVWATIVWGYEHPQMVIPTANGPLGTKSSQQTHILIIDSWWQISDWCFDDRWWIPGSWCRWLIFHDSWLVIHFDNWYEVPGTVNCNRYRCVISEDNFSDRSFIICQLFCWELMVVVSNLTIHDGRWMSRVRACVRAVRLVHGRPRREDHRVGNGRGQRRRLLARGEQLELFLGRGRAVQNPPRH